MTTCLLRANSAGEILDAEGNVIGKVVPVEPTIAMLVDAVKVRHGDATYRCVSAAGCATFEQEARDDYKAMLAAGGVDLSGAVVREDEIRRAAEREAVRACYDIARGWVEGSKIGADIRQEFPEAFK